uniref:Uncharacterized protein n=1 Tax=Timema poppense TaxID=170557 RepID=A0A7R9DK15_TIMPO|nr:unnamed protein product [Timema poppensis]
MVMGRESSGYHEKDCHTSAWYLFICSSRAFGLWLDAFSNLFVAVVTFTFLLVPEASRSGQSSECSPSHVGQEEGEGRDGMLRTALRNSQAGQYLSVPLRVEAWRMEIEVSCLE